MRPAWRSEDGSGLLRPQKRMESVEKPLCSGEGQACFPWLESMSKERRCSRRQIKMLLGRMLTNLPQQKHAHHVKGVQYEITSFTEGAYGGACSVLICKRSTKT